MTVADYYSVLDIEPDAKADEVRRAYYRLARINHPDLQGGESSSEAHERFLLIQQAYETLGSPLERQKYDEHHRAAVHATADNGSETSAEKKSKPFSGKTEKKVSLDDIRKARMAFMRAEELMDTGDVERVATVMQAVVRVVDDEPEYLSLFGYALALDGQRLHMARDLCRRSSEAEPFNIEFKARLGYVYHRAGLQKTADTIFTEILTVVPEHPIAKAYNSEALSGAGGLLGLVKKLFGSK